MIWHKSKCHVINYFPCSSNVLMKYCLAYIYTKIYLLEKIPFIFLSLPISLSYLYLSLSGNEDELSKVCVSVSLLFYSSLSSFFFLSPAFLLTFFEKIINLKNKPFNNPLPSILGFSLLLPFKFQQL